MQYEKMENLIKSLGKTVSSYLYQDNGYWEIGTNFFDNKNDGIIVYAIFDEYGDIIIDDDKATYWCCEPLGFDFTTNKAVEKILKSSHKIKCINELLEIKTNEKDFVADFCMYISVLLQIIGAAQQTNKMEA